MKIFLASLVIGLLALLAGNKADQQADVLSRRAINLPPADSPMPVNTPQMRRVVIDGSEIPVNPFAAPDAQGRPVLKDPVRQSQLESARVWFDIAPHAYKLAWMAPFAGLAFMLVGRMIRRMIPQVETTEQASEPVVVPKAETDKAANTCQPDSDPEPPKEDV